MTRPTAFAIVCLAALSCQHPAPSTPAVIARVNGEPIHRADFEQAFRVDSHEEMDAHGKVPPERAEKVRALVYVRLIAQKLVVQRARALGIVATDEEVERALVEAFPGRARLAQAERDTGAPESYFRDQARHSVLMARVQEHMTRNAVFSEAEVARELEALSAGASPPLQRPARAEAVERLRSARRTRVVRDLVASADIQEIEIMGGHRVGRVTDAKPVPR